VNKNSKGIVHLFLLIVIVLIGIGGLLYYSWQMRLINFHAWQKRLADPNFLKTLSPTPTAVLEETADWKTYTNETYKYSFKYPSDFEIQELPPAGLEPMFAVVLRDNNNNQIFSIKTDKDYLPGDIL